MYIIDMITDNDGREKVDGRYPLRKGCIGSIYNLKNAEPMIFEYSKDNQGNDKQGYLKTSLVKFYNEHVNREEIAIHTMNSIYYLKKI